MIRSARKFKTPPVVWSLFCLWMLVFSSNAHASVIGIGVTGVAGPDGGSDEKPIGTVCIGVVGPGSDQEARTSKFPGDRAMVRRLATQTALDLLRRVLLRRMREHATVRGG